MTNIKIKVWNWKRIPSHRIYLVIGSIISVATLIFALTFGLANAQGVSSASVLGVEISAQEEDGQ